MDQAASAEVYLRQRRSTRILQAIPLIIAGCDASGASLQEQTATLSINCHGCRYFSRHRVERNAWLTLEIHVQATLQPRRMRARVAWVQSSRRLRGLFQVGVEFEAPANIWDIARPPEDWQKFGTAMAFDSAAFAREMERLLAVAKSTNHYQLLGVNAMASRSQIKRSFHELARNFHPDRHMDHPEWAEALHVLMDALTVAYKTLSDEGLRQAYDQRLIESGAFILGQNKSDAQKSAAECLEKARECLRAKNYVGSIVWLRKAVEIEPDSSRYQALLARSLSVVPQYRREAVTHFEKAIELDPLNVWALFHFGKLYEDMNLPWRAHALYEKVIELDPEHTHARERLGAIDCATHKGGPAQPKLIHRLINRISK